MPQQSRGEAVFWACHYQRHEGVNCMVHKIKQQKLYFPDIANVILNFLSQSPPYQGKKSIYATSTTQILALDLYEYDKKNYLIVMDIYYGVAYTRSSMANLTLLITVKIVGE